MRSEWIKPWSKSRRSKKFGGQWAWGQRSEIRGYREQYKRKGLGGPDPGVKCVYSQKWFHSVALRYKCHQRSEHIVGSYPNCLLGLSWVNCPTQRPHAAIWEKWSWEVLLKKGVYDLRGQSWIRKERPVIKKSDLEKSRGSGDAIGIEQARVWGLSIQCKSWASPDLFQYIHSCPIQEKTKKLWYIKLSPWPLNTWVQCSTTEVVGAATSTSLLLQGNETWLLIYSGCQGQGEWGRLEALQGTRRNITEVCNQEAADGREPAPALTSDAGSSKSLFYPKQRQKLYKKSFKAPASSHQLWNKTFMPVFWLQHCSFWISCIFKKGEESQLLELLWTFKESTSWVRACMSRRRETLPSWDISVSNDLVKKGTPMFV